MSGLLKTWLSDQSLLTIQDQELCTEIACLINKTKTGHLAPYHYGEPYSHDDQVRGAMFWDRHIQSSPNYYQFQAENVTLPLVVQFLSRLLSKETISLIDLGPGSGHALQAKTFPFLYALLGVANYIPVDISKDYLTQTEQHIKKSFRQLPITTQQKNYFNEHVSFDVNTIPVFLFLSSSISNLPEINSDYRPQLRHILSHLYEGMHRPGYLVVSHDCNQDETSLIKAYTDPAHVAFGQNIMYRIKRDAADPEDTGFQPEAWAYHPEWYVAQNLLAHTVCSTKDQSILLNGREHLISKGQKLVVDNSYKYKVPDFLSVCEDVGFAPIKTFMDDTRRVAVHVLAREE